jgi:nucleotide-binding universal stress UspA family protein
MLARRSILVGVDGSPSSLEAVRWAARETARRDAPLRLLHGCLPDEPAEQGRDWLREAENAAREVTSVPIRTALRIGPPTDELAVASRSAALVVLGSRGLGGISGLTLGSVTVAIAGYGYCPAVVVREEAPPEIGAIVVGADGSSLSDAAVEFAFGAAAARGALLIAVRALAPADDHEDLGERLAPWQSKYPDVELLRQVVEDRPVRALLHAARDAQLVVVGARGRGGFGLGSTSRALLRYADCPVTVIRP